MSQTKLIYCCECQIEINAVLLTGKEVYPHRPDLKDLPFWQCNDCGNFVGCHHKTKNRTKPLGTIPNERIRKVRQLIHATIDPVWQTGEYTRKAVYGEMSRRLNKSFHVAEVSSIKEAEYVLKVAHDVVRAYDTSLKYLIQQAQNNGTT